MEAVPIEPANLVGVLTLQLHQGTDLHDTDVFGTQDPYVNFYTDDETNHRKSAVCKKGGKTPKWNDVFTWELVGKETYLDINVKAQKMISDDLIGKARLPLVQLLNTNAPMWYHIVREVHPAGSIQISTSFKGTRDGQFIDTTGTELKGLEVKAAAPAPMYVPMPAPAPVAAPIYAPAPAAYVPDMGNYPPQHHHETQEHELKHFNEEAGYEDEPRLHHRFAPLPATLSDLRIKLTWVDQGHGHRKGTVWVKLVRNGDIIAEAEPFGVVDHQEETHERSLKNHEVVQMSQAGDVIEVWRYIGAGGGHKLKIHNFRVWFHF